MLGGHMIGIRRSQVDFDSGLIALDPDETKNREGRQVPILEGDMEDLLLEAKKARDDAWPNSEWVFNRQGTQAKDIRGSWRLACLAAASGLPQFDVLADFLKGLRIEGLQSHARTIDVKQSHGGWHCKEFELVHPWIVVHNAVGIVASATILYVEEPAIDLELSGCVGLGIQIEIQSNLQHREVMFKVCLSLRSPHWTT